MIKNLAKRERCRYKRALRVRKNLRGDAARPRMSVTKTNKHIFVQIINDEEGQTLVSLGTLSKEFKGTKYNQKSKETARHIGEKIAEYAKSKNIDKVVYDRGRLKYHGIIAELADSARKAGLQF